MLDIKQRISEFSKLDYEYKKNTLIEMLSWLKDSDENFAKLFDILKTHKNLEANLLDSIYSDILEFADAIKNWEMWVQIYKINLLGQKIKKIQELENLEREKENPEMLLNQI